MNEGPSRQTTKRAPKDQQRGDARRDVGAGVGVGGSEGSTKPVNECGE